MVDDLKKLNSLSKQIEQYESHLAIVKNEMNSFSDKRDAAKVDLESVQKKILKAQEDFEKSCLAKREELAREVKAAELERARVTEDRQAALRERAQSATLKDSLEMSRRNLENDKRRVAEFIQIIDQAVKAWK